MLKQTIRKMANTFGVDIHRFSNDEWRWSCQVQDYYALEPTSRWGHGKPPHPQLSAKLNEQRDQISALLRTFAQYSPLMASIALEGDSNSRTPYWRNTWFEDLDGAALIGMLASSKPATYIEIGSGNSTKFARHAIDRAGLATSLISVDPKPRAVIDSLCDEIIREPLEKCDLSLFDRLEPGDIAFFDGSHRVFTNSDVTVFFLEVLPRLKSGVIFHVHDIFLPWDYKPDWSRRLYSEQYMLAAMLLSHQPPFKVLLPNLFACTDPELAIAARSLMAPLGCAAQGLSFWAQVI